MTKLEWCKLHAPEALRNLTDSELLECMGSSYEKFCSDKQLKSKYVATNLKWEEMKSQYPDKWLLLANTVVTDGGDVISGDIVEVVDSKYFDDRLMYHTKLNDIDYHVYTGVYSSVLLGGMYYES